MYLQLNKETDCSLECFLTLDEVDTIILGLAELEEPKASKLQTELIHLKAKAKIKGKQTYGRNKKNCEHKNREYIPTEVENYVYENLICLDCLCNLSLEREDI